MTRYTVALGLVSLTAVVALPSWPAAAVAVALLASLAGSHVAALHDARSQRTTDADRARLASLEARCDELQRRLDRASFR